MTSHFALHCHTFMSYRCVPLKISRGRLSCILQKNRIDKEKYTVTPEPTTTSEQRPPFLGPKGVHCTKVKFVYNVLGVGLCTDLT